MNTLNPAAPIIIGHIWWNVDNIMWNIRGRWMATIAPIIRLFQKNQYLCHCDYPTKGYSAPSMKTEPDKARFEELFHLYYPKVRSFAAILLKSEQEAEDVAQDIFVRLWETPDLWEGNLEKNYLYTMVKNSVFNRIKRKNLESKYIHTQQDLQGITELAEFEDPLNEIYREELQLLLMLALEQLPGKRREVFKLSRFQHLSNQEIAEKMNLSVRTVEQHIYLALKELKKLLIVAIFLMNF
jgi:RNA polymerase sigma-70 factor (ECF subfamily)